MEVGTPVAIITRTPGYQGLRRRWHAMLCDGPLLVKTSSEPTFVYLDDLLGFMRPDRLAFARDLCRRAGVATNGVPSNDQVLIAYQRLAERAGGRDAA